MESVLMDQSPMNPRRSFPTTAAAFNHSNIHGGGLLGGSASSYSSSSFAASISQLFLNVQAGNRDGLFGSRPPPPLLYTSLPSFAVTPPPPSQQPPLLPLPFSESATLPSPSKRIAAAGAVRSRQHKSKPRPSAGARKEARSCRPGTKPVEKPPVPVKPEEGGEEEFLGRSLYSISPPPSSLPLPRFSLTRPKPATSSCNVEAVGGGGGGVDAGVTDDLHRLLRL